MKKVILIVLMCVPISLLGQLPETEIYVFDLMKQGSTWTLSNEQKVRTEGAYNNQPHFTTDGRYMLFVSSGKSNGKTDIYRYDMKKKRIKQLTKTKQEAEYSPQLTPSRTKISCVRVEADTTTQAFYTYNLKGKKAKRLLPDLKTVGYYAWHTNNDLITFNVPEPFSLNHYFMNNEKTDSLGIHIGRCLHHYRGKTFYVDKTDSSKWYVKELNPRRWSNSHLTFNEQIITETIAGQEDYAFLPDGSMLMGDGGVIFQKNKVLKGNDSGNWEAIFDLNQYGITQFYRIVVSPNYQKLAVVSFDGEKP